jgi:hypothetical protein
VPGCRAPHFWLADGSSLYDALGPGYTLLRFSPFLDVFALQSAAADRRMPLTIVDIPDKGVPEAYQHKLLICRDDQHVAWRSDEPPQDPVALVATLCGTATVSA